MAGFGRAGESELVTASVWSVVGVSVGSILALSIPVHGWESGFQVDWVFDSEVD